MCFLQYQRQLKLYVKIITVGLKYHSRLKEQLFRVNILEEKTISYDSSLNFFVQRCFNLYEEFKLWATFICSLKMQRWGKSKILYSYVQKCNVLKYLYSLFDIYTHLEITPNYKYRSEKAHIFLIKFPKNKTYDHGGFVTETP